MLYVVTYGDIAYGKYHAITAEGELDPDIRGANTKGIRRAIAEVDMMNFMIDFSEDKLALQEAYLRSTTE